jgi:hypothetical protein
MTTFEQRSIYSGPIRRALENLEHRLTLVEDGGGGTPGPGGSVSYVHNQGVAAATWVVDHNLGWYPNVTVKDSTGDVVEGNITYNDSNRVTLGFSGAFAGIAYLS